MRNGDEVLAALRRTVAAGLVQVGAEPNMATAERFVQNRDFEEILALAGRWELEVDVYLGSKYGF